MPLHFGKIPTWLSERMGKMGSAIVESVAQNYGKSEVLTRFSNPNWFQAMGAVMGMQWNSSGVTASVLGSLKRKINPMANELGIYILGGKGKYSYYAPRQIQAVSNKHGLNGDELVTACKLTRRVDNNAVQDGFNLYQQYFLVTDEGEWAGISQGMNTRSRRARRYHWHSPTVRSFVDNPHKAIVGQQKKKILNLADGRANYARSNIVNLTKELATRGHEVLIRNKCVKASTIKGVYWQPISEGMPKYADLFIANRGDKLIPLMPYAKRTIFWTHNPARYLLKWRYMTKLWRIKPSIVFIGDYHASTYPWWAPGGSRIIIPYGISEDFRTMSGAKTVPPPRAIFTSNPLRSLDWLLSVWQRKIHPILPNSELHLFAGAITYGSVGSKKEQKILAVVEQARTLESEGVVIRDPVSKSKLIEEFRKARVMLYKGDKNETFCLALGEAQAAGVPAVVQRHGSVVERVKDGLTGAITDTDDAFAEASVKLLSDDEHWFKTHKNSRALQRGWSWSQAADAFERLIPT